MLDGGADPFALHALDVSYGGSRREEWVFPEVLEISAAHWSAINIDSRAQHKMHSSSTGILSDHGADAVSKLGIPCCRKANAAKDCGRSVVPNSDWTIGHLQPWQPNLRIGADIKIVNAANEINF